MRKFLSVLLVIVIGFGIFISDADAARFGGGRSFGMSRSISSFSRLRPIASPIRNTATPNRNRWLGPLAGLAAGGLLASLFMGHGLANGMMSWLLVGGIIMLLMNLFRNFSRHQAQPAQHQYQMFRNDAAQQSRTQDDTYAGHTANLPSDFDEYDFLRTAKVQFIRLQAAYDQKNLDDIRAFTTPEVFAEINLQLQERGSRENYTEVVTLDAKLLDAATEFQIPVASVEFSGLIKEDINAPSASFNEIWHFRKDTNSGQWLTAGIQQHQ